jgi:hypothetical protein
VKTLRPLMALVLVLWLQACGEHPSCRGHGDSSASRYRLLPSITGLSYWQEATSAGTISVCMRPDGSRRGHSFDALSRPFQSWSAGVKATPTIAPSGA